MKLLKLTTEEIRNNSARDYNPQIWDKKVDSYLPYTNTEFYICPKGEGFDYDRFFVIYTLPTGLRLLNKFGYSSSVTSTGFAAVYFNENNEVITRMFQNGTGVGRLEKNDSNRAFLSDLCKKHGLVVTSCI